jgi:hypothetical protein
MNLERFESRNLSLDVRYCSSFTGYWIAEEAQREESKFWPKNVKQLLVERIVGDVISRGLQNKIEAELLDSSRG